jgi:hypothetical protein
MALQDHSSCSGRLVAQVGAQEAGMPERQVLADRCHVAGQARVQSCGSYSR